MFKTGSLMAAVGAAAMVIVWVPEARPHDAQAIADAAMGDLRRGDWFSSLTQPDNGISCCNLADCEQTSARQLADRSWEAIIVDPKGRRWTAVPPNKIVTRIRSIDGEAYICNAKTAIDRIYCFVPPVPGY